ncbi:hypothetical protein VKT23_016211 [Stygiomarasmius scandens]|uniref:Uncharacterized protein n=1 Tax=Marasmiellus scandens TaxID=2682957 RepID=A0ABR1IVQ1_9AGAR
MVDLANSRGEIWLKITRIIRVTNNGKGEFWVKAWNKQHAGWLIQLCEDLGVYFENIFWVKISLLRLDEWRNQNGAHESCYWENPKPMDPAKEVEWRQENPLILPRLNISLEERLEEIRPIPTSSSTPINHRRKKTRRAGTKVKLIQDQYGPFPVNDPNVNFENWDWTEWLGEVWTNNKRKD